MFGSLLPEKRSTKPESCRTGPSDLLSDNQRFPGVDPSSPNFLVGLLFSGSFAFFILRVFSVTNTSYLSTTQSTIPDLTQFNHAIANLLESTKLTSQCLIKGGQCVAEMWSNAAYPHTELRMSSCSVTLSSGANT